MPDQKPSDFSSWSCIERGKIYFIQPENTSAYGKRKWYQRDIDQIIYSTVFRKLQRKSQLLPVIDPRRRTRLIHTLEVARIAKEIGIRLNLDTQLIEAISYGHDLANSAYGAVGNNVLGSLSSGKNKFTHEVASMLMVQTISAKKITRTNPSNIGRAEVYNLFQNNEDGKNPTWRWNDCLFDIQLGKIEVNKNHSNFFEYIVSLEVLDGILKHNRGEPYTIEGQVVQFSDNFAYLSQDVDDLIKCDLMDADQYESFARRTLEYNGERKTWDEINNFYPDVELENVFNRKSGARISTLIERFVSYNLHRLSSESEDIQYRYSPILEKEIPVLEMDPGLSFVNKVLWNYIETFYEKRHLKSASSIQKKEIRELFGIIKNTNLKNDNKCIAEFLNSLESTRFKKYSFSWKICYLISHFSWDEVKLIIDNYHKRDYNFKLDLSYDTIYQMN